MVERGHTHNTRVITRTDSGHDGHDGQDGREGARDQGPRRLPPLPAAHVRKVIYKAHVLKVINEAHALKVNEAHALKVINEAHVLGQP